MSIVGHIKFEPNENHVTVFLRKNQSKKLPFRCIYCGQLQCNIGAKVAMIVDTEVRETDYPVEIYCTNCRTTYHIE